MMMSIDKKTTIYIVCWQDNKRVDESLFYPAIVNESRAFLSKEEAARYQIALDDDARNHGWNPEEAGYIVKTMDIDEEEI